VIADRRAKPPQEDLVSILCHAEIDGEKLDDESLVQETLLILIGGDETTRHVISCGMLALMDHPDQRAILAGADPDTMTTGVEELLRWVTPIKNMSRTVTRDVEIDGQALHEDDQLILLYPSANRDEDVFADPYRLDVRREPNPHLAFGFGTHFCLGASLARLELNVMFDELGRRLPDIELTTDEPLPFRASNFIVGPEAMPVRFTPTPKAGS
jgi:cytochrome P450 family 142 subfamily A polypeptide 1